MQMSLILALGVGKAVMASHMARNASATNTSSIVMPQTVGEFSLVGCAGDEADFANFKMVAQSEHMSLNLCAAGCSSKYFATHADECHCADEFATDSTQDKPESCGIPCPGNDKEACGGPGSALARRGDSRKLYTVYGRNSKPETSTKIEYHVHTITACPPTVVDCPVAPHVTTQTKTVTTEICPAPEWHKKKIVCYGPHCAPEYPCEGEDCKKERVICQGDHCWTEECPHGEEWNRLVIYKGANDVHYATDCHSDDCDKKIICYDGKCVTEKCAGNECSKNLVCNGEECHYAKCDSDECQKKIVCQGGKDCTVVAPCKDDSCPKPSPPKPVITPAPGYNNGNNNGYNNGNNNGYNNGNNGDNNGNKGDNKGNNNGDNKGNNGDNKGNNNGYNNGNNGDNKGNNNGYNNPDNKGNNVCYPPNCKPAPGGTATGTGFPRPTLPPPMVGGAERNGFTFVGALAGLALLL